MSKGIVDPPKALQDSWAQLMTFFAGELIELVHKNAVIGADENEKCWFVAHQILSSRDINKALSAEVARLLGVGVA